MASTSSDRSSIRSPDPETIRLALIDAALAAYNDAGLSGLCADGRWEAAIGALRTLDLNIDTSRTHGAELQEHEVPGGTDTTRGA